MNNNIKVGNSLYIRDLNQASIFRLINKYGPISRKDLANNTDYSTATVTNHVNRLLTSGYVIETEKGDSTGGRKPVYLDVSPNKAYIIVISIEVKRIEVILFNLKLSIEYRVSFSINGKPIDIIKNVLNEIEFILKDRNIKEESIIGIGVSVPGLIDREHNSLVFAPNLGWANVPIADLIKERFALPVVVENEANGAALGEIEFGNSEIDNMVYVSINEGIGCGIIFNGKLYKGSSGNAGEFGHIIIDRSGPNCHCGNKGCWEAMASENFIVNAVNEKLNENLNIEDIYELAKQDNQVVINILKTAGINIGIGLRNIINSLNPEYLILGGNNISKIKEYIYDDLVNIVEEEALPVSLEKTNIKFSKLDGSAVVYGIAYLVYNRFFEL